MARKKKEKLEIGDLGPLSHNPFAALGQGLGVKSSGDTTPEPKQEKTQTETRAVVMVRLEKRKKGKVVTCIYHLGEDCKALLKQLKQKLGTGGTITQDALELQGDHRQAALSWLGEKGYRVRAGN